MACRASPIYIHALLFMCTCNGKPDDEEMDYETMVKAARRAADATRNAACFPRCRRLSVVVNIVVRLAVIATQLSTGASLPSLPSTDAARDGRGGGGAEGRRAGCPPVKVGFSLK